LTSLNVLGGQFIFHEKRENVLQNEHIWHPYGLA